MSIIDTSGDSKDASTRETSKAEIAEVQDSSMCMQEPTEEPESFTCYLLNRKNVKTKFIAQLTHTTLCVVSENSGAVKTDIELNSCHVREMPTETRSDPETDR